MKHHLSFRSMGLLAAALLLGACGNRNQAPKSGEMTGNDRDEHGCIATAGYTWSEVRQDCIRIFEQGVRVESVTGDSSAFIVFSPDSARAELFFSNGDPNEILDRRNLPGGGHAWNVEDDDTKNVRLTDGLWSIERRGKLIYREYMSAGKVVRNTYEGVLPAADGPGIRYRLTITSPEHSGDGRFSLTQTYLGARNGKDQTFVTEGRRYTLRGMPGNDDATVWQLIAKNGPDTVNFQSIDDSTLLLLNARLEKPQSKLDYRLHRIERADR